MTLRYDELHITYSILDIGFLFKCITVVSGIHVFTDNSIFKEADNYFKFMNRLITLFISPSIGQTLVGKQQVVNLQRLVKLHKHCSEER